MLKTSRSQAFRSGRRGTQRAPQNCVNVIVPVVVMLMSIGLAVAAAAGLLGLVLRAMPTRPLGVPEA